VPDESNYTIPMCLTIVDGHRLQVLDEGYSAQYITKYCTYYAEDGDMIGRVEIYGGDDSFHAIWEGYRFPFVNPSTALLGLEQDENGYMYLLVSMANDMWIEYVTDATFDLLSLRIYLPDENGVYRLVSLVGWETAPAPEIPQLVLDLIALEPVQ